MLFMSFRHLGSGREGEGKEFGKVLTRAYVEDATLAFAWCD